MRLVMTPAASPVARRGTIPTRDGVSLDSVLLPGAAGSSTAVIVANGFTGSWRKPSTRAVAGKLREVGDVMMFDFRGHYGSTGRCTLGDREVLDVEAVVERLRGLGYTRIVTVGFSMGAAVVLRHAAIHGGLAATVAVSGPGRWYYRGTARMRLLHLGAERPLGRAFLRLGRRVRMIDRPWDPVPAEPFEAAEEVAPIPLLIVHGDADPYFPTDHAHRLYAAANAPKELWIEPRMGHAESAMTRECLSRVVAWLGERLPAHAESDHVDARLAAGRRP